MKVEKEMEIMAIGQAIQRIDELSPEYQEIVTTLIEKLLAMSAKEEQHHNNVVLGLGEGTETIPDDMDWCNDEIAEMFGV